MPKLKTSKGVKARFKVTGRGKLRAFKAGRRHLLGCKRSKAKRKMRRPQMVAKPEADRLRVLLPYQ